ncbi:Crp1 protein [Martiniozyma asiatica (nom. inval.)]|nr:Crp1 protein [Martiniozyma asiatica]
MASFTFTWPADPSVKDVIVTGTFDNWSQSLPLVKTSDGSWSLEVPLPSETEKFEFKFVLNGTEWVTSDKYWTVADDNDNLNNYVELKDGDVKTKTIIPESGLSMGKTEAGKTEAGKTQLGKTELSTTVMPSEEGKQTTLGEPGIVVPENPREIEAFTQVRDVDAKKLNEQMKAQEESGETQTDDATSAAAPKSQKYVKKVKKEKKGIFGKLKKILN